MSFCYIGVDISALCNNDDDLPDGDVMMTMVTVRFNDNSNR